MSERLRVCVKESNRIFKTFALSEYIHGGLFGGSSTNRVAFVIAAEFEQIAHMESYRQDRGRE